MQPPAALNTTDLRGPLQRKASLGRLTTADSVTPGARSAPLSSPQGGVAARLARDKEALQNNPPHVARAARQRAARRRWRLVILVVRIANTLRNLPRQRPRLTVSERHAIAQLHEARAGTLAQFSGIADAVAALGQNVSDEELRAMLAFVGFYKRGNSSMRTAAQQNRAAAPQLGASVLAGAASPSSLPSSPSAAASSTRGATLVDRIAGTGTESGGDDGSGTVLSLPQLLKIAQILKHRFVASRTSDAFEAYAALVAAEQDVTGTEAGRGQDRGVDAARLREVVKAFDLAVDVDAIVASMDEDGTGRLEFREFCDGMFGGDDRAVVAVGAGGGLAVRNEAGDSDDGNEDAREAVGGGAADGGDSMNDADSDDLRRSSRAMSHRSAASAKAKNPRRWGPDPPKNQQLPPPPAFFVPASAGWSGLVASGFESGAAAPVVAPTRRSGSFRQSSPPAAGGNGKTVAAVSVSGNAKLHSALVAVNAVSAISTSVGSGGVGTSGSALEVAGSTSLAAPPALGAVGFSSGSLVPSSSAAAFPVFSLSPTLLPPPLGALGTAKSAAGNVAFGGASAFNGSFSSGGHGRNARGVARQQRHAGNGGGVASYAAPSGGPSTVVGGRRSSRVVGVADPTVGPGAMAVLAARATEALRAVTAPSAPLFDPALSSQLPSSWPTRDSVSPSHRTYAFPPVVMNGATAASQAAAAGNRSLRARWTPTAVLARVAELQPDSSCVPRISRGTTGVRYCVDSAHSPPSFGAVLPMAETAAPAVPTAGRSAGRQKGAVAPSLSAAASPPAPVAVAGGGLATLTAAALGHHTFKSGGGGPAQDSEPALYDGGGTLSSLAAPQRQQQQQNQQHDGVTDQQQGHRQLGQPHHRPGRSGGARGEALGWGETIHLNHDRYLDYLAEPRAQTPSLPPPATFSLLRPATAETSQALAPPGGVAAQRRREAYFRRLPSKSVDALSGTKAWTLKPEERNAVLERCLANPPSLCAPAVGAAGTAVPTPAALLPPQKRRNGPTVKPMGGSSGGTGGTTADVVAAVRAPSRERDGSGFGGHLRLLAQALLQRCDERDGVRPGDAASSLTRRESAPPIL